MTHAHRAAILIALPIAACCDGTTDPDGIFCQDPTDEIDSDLGCWRQGDEPIATVTTTSAPEAPPILGCQRMSPEGFCQQGPIANGAGLARKVRELPSRATGDRLPGGFAEGEPAEAYPSVEHGHGGDPLAWAFSVLDHYALPYDPATQHHAKPRAQLIEVYSSASDPIDWHAVAERLRSTGRPVPDDIFEQPTR